MSTIAEDKRAAVEKALEEGIVMLHVDARHPEVAVPAHLAGDPGLLLNIAYGFNLPALEIDEEGIYAVLSFGGVNQGCTVVWDALYAITQPELEGRGCLWPGSAPQEAVAHLPEMAGVDRVDFGPPPTADQEADPAPAPEVEEKPRDRGHLRLVKG